MKVHVGDKIVVTSEGASLSSRAGVIREVLRDAPLRVRVRWEDGQTSILTPSAGVARIIPQGIRIAAFGRAWAPGPEIGDLREGVVETGLELRDPSADPGVRREQ